jgi:hypothetical protein
MLVTDLIPPAELNGFVRDLDPAVYGFTLNRFLPDQPRQDIEYAFNRAEAGRNEMAHYRAFDTEAQIVSRRGFARVRGEIPSLSLKMPLGEELRLRIAAAGRAGGPNPQIIDQIFDDAATLTEGCLARLELARGEALFTGKVTFGVDAGFTADIKIDYGTPTALPVPGMLWSNPASTPVADLVAMATAYRLANGGADPGVILTSRKVIAAVLRTTEVRQFASFQGMVPSIVGAGQLAQILAAQGLPQIETYDTAVNYAGTNFRATPEHMVAMLPAPDVNRFGETTFGITAESIELVGSNYETIATAPGLTGVTMRTFDPVGLWTKVAALAVPVIKDPRRIGTAAVLAPASPVVP